MTNAVGEPVITAIKVRIKGNHSHSGESGRIEFRDGKTETISVYGAEMFLVVLDNCQHGNSGCYATKQNLEMIK